MTQQMTCNDSWEAAILPTEQLPSVEERKVVSKAPDRVKKAVIWQFMRFCIVGASNSIIDFGVLNLLLWLYPITDTWKTLGYNSVAVLLAATNSFFWNKYWTFQKRSPVTVQEVYRFIVVASGTMLMNDMLMWLLAEILPGIMRSSLLGANALKLGAIIGTMSISFFGMRLWVFLQKRYGDEARSLADCETIKLPLIKRVDDVDTVIVGAIKPVHAVDTMILCAPEKPKLNMLTIKTRFIEYAPTQTLEFLSDEDINHYPDTLPPGLCSEQIPASNLRSVKLISCPSDGASEA